MTDWWIKLHRKTMENPIIMRDCDHVWVWIYLLLNASHKKQKNWFWWEEIILQPWQLITGRKKLASALKISESKIERVLKLFEKWTAIEQQTNSQSRLITIRNRALYQQSEQRSDNKWTTSEQQVNTIQECKNVRMKECNKKESKISSSKIQATPGKLKTKKTLISEQEREQSSPLVPPAPPHSRSDLDELIQTLKATADTLWIAYNKTRDRQFAKHLMDAFDYWEFASKLWKTRIELAVGVMKASLQIWYRKWVAWWPMLIYQNYSDIYNNRVSKTQKEELKKKPIIYSPVL